jgi:alkylation response protein AidB-like acyl-CoA dehydrogenase
VDRVASDALIATPDDSAFSRLFLWSRADTIYGGSDQIQRNVIGERALGLPPEPKVTT